MTDTELYNIYSYIENYLDARVTDFYGNVSLSPSSSYPKEMTLVTLDTYHKPAYDNILKFFNDLNITMMFPLYSEEYEPGEMCISASFEISNKVLEPLQGYIRIMSGKE